jgi:hypothetical protein
MACSLIVVFKREGIGFLHPPLDKKNKEIFYVFCVLYLALVLSPNM